MTAAKNAQKASNMQASQKPEGQLASSKPDKVRNDLGDTHAPTKSSAGSPPPPGGSDDCDQKFDKFETAMIKFNADQTPVNAFHAEAAARDYVENCKDDPEYADFKDGMDFLLNNVFKPNGMN